jgi:hypothetical protein
MAASCSRARIRKDFIGVDHANMGMRRRRSPHRRDFGADLSAFNREGQHLAVSGPTIADFGFDCDTLRLVTPKQHDAPNSNVGHVRLPSMAGAASILTAIYHMLKDGTTYHDLGREHFDRRSTDQQKNPWSKRLADLGYAVEIKPLAATAEARQVEVAA